ncbi:MAG: hypothetical protein Harvfovirus69_1, partial [Harvfovirus sp.]
MSQQQYLSGIANDIELFVSKYNSLVMMKAELEKKDNDLLLINQGLEKINSLLRSSGAGKKHIGGAITRHELLVVLDMTLPVLVKKVAMYKELKNEIIQLEKNVESRSENIKRLIFENDKLEHLLTGNRDEYFVQRAAIIDKYKIPSAYYKTRAATAAAETGAAPEIERIQKQAAAA